MAPLLLIAGSAFAQIPGLRLPVQAGGPQPACITVQNQANGWFPVELRFGQAKPIAFRAEVGPPQQFCLPLTMPADARMEVKVKSWMNPVGICHMRPGTGLQIVRLTPRGEQPFNEVRCPN